MSPNHVFRIELGDRKLGKVDLTQYEIASEISFLFADTAPDDHDGAPFVVMRPSLLSRLFR
ncbi:MAG TPA: hypothetical protein VJN18_10010 [Polyangiaceae bacterium]|nr:hypothetical protein [Polyangiaceae bacterium]